MNATTTVAVDLAKSVFQLAVADASWRVVQTHRLSRTQFERWFVNRDIGLVIVQACGSSHHWARWLALATRVTWAVSPIATAHAAHAWRPKRVAGGQGG